MYDWLVSVLDLPATASEAVVLGSVLLVLMAFAFLSKLLYRVFR